MDKNHSLKLKFHIITPIVMQGNMGVTEIRPNSIRGVLRWWLRASINPEKRNEIEEKIFGSNSVSSKTRIFPINTDNLTVINVNDEQPKWNHPLFYFNYNISNRNAFKENNSFDVKIAFANIDDEQRNILLQTIYLLSFLGGIGARTRRGYGSVMIDCLNDSYNSYTRFNYSNLKTINDYLEVLKTLIQSNHMNNGPLNYYHVSNLSVYIDYGNSNKGYTSYIDALQSVKNKMQSVRGNKSLSGYSTDIKPLLKNFVDTNSLSATNIKIENFGFGLPLNYQSRSLKKSLGSDAKVVEVNFNAQDFERMASPILIKVIKIGSSYYPIISYFRNDLIKQGQKITAKFSARFQDSSKNFRERLNSKLDISFSHQKNIPKFIDDFLSNFVQII